VREHERLHERGDEEEGDTAGREVGQGDNLCSHKAAQNRLVGQRLLS
jgi:hypothetical protein